MSEIIVTTATELETFIGTVVKQAVSEALREKQLPILLSIPEAANLLGVSDTTMYRATKIQGFPSTTDFGHTKIVTEQMLEWIKNRSNYDLVYNFGS